MDVYSILEQGPQFLRLKVETNSGLARVVLEGDARTKDLTGWVSPAAAKKAFEAEKSRYEKERA